MLTDKHTETAAHIFGCDTTSVTPEQRSFAKALTFKVRSTVTKKDLSFMPNANLTILVQAKNVCEHGNIVSSCHTCA